MRILVFGGTAFIGRAAARKLARRRHQVALCHRGRTEPPELADATHFHVDRADAVSLREAIARFAPDVVLDTYALTGEDVQHVLPVIPAGVPVVVLSSQDVYAAFDGFLSGTVVAPVPLREGDELRSRRYLYQDDAPPGVPANYEKIDVETAWRERGATIIRLPMVYGPRDPQCREGFVLRRIAAGRTRMPIGAATLLWSRAHVEDVAEAIAASVEEATTDGEILNIAEPSTPSMELWIRQIARAAGVEMELVPVPDDVLPPDLMLTKAHPQHVLADVSRATERLRWKPRPSAERIADSVRWHLEHRTYAPWSDADSEADESAIRRAVAASRR